MKMIVLAFIAGVILTLSIAGIPNVIVLWKSISDREILSQTADKWWVEGFNTGLQARWGDLFEEQVYYDIPSGGYIYKDDYDGSPGYCLRYNHDSFNGTLDYQITLNPMTLDGFNRY